MVFGIAHFEKLIYNGDISGSNTSLYALISAIVND